MVFICGPSTAEIERDEALNLVAQLKRELAEEKARNVRIEQAAASKSKLLKEKSAALTKVEGELEVVDRHKYDENVKKAAEADAKADEYLKMVEASETAKKHFEKALQAEKVKMEAEILLKNAREAQYKIETEKAQADKALKEAEASKLESELKTLKLEKQQALANTEIIKKNIAAQQELHKEVEMKLKEVVKSTSKDLMNAEAQLKILTTESEDLEHEAEVARVRVLILVIFRGLYLYITGVFFNSGGACEKSNLVLSHLRLS